MSAEMNSPLPGAWPAAPRRAERAVPPARPVTGVLADGTPFFAPAGEVVRDGPLVICHLCGRPWRSVTAHLRAHGWTKDAYCAVFGLERGQSLEGPETRKLRAAALASRLVFDAAFREGSAAGRRRARTGALTRDAAAGTRGGARLPPRRPDPRRGGARPRAAASRAAPPDAPPGAGHDHGRGGGRGQRAAGQPSPG